MRAISYSTVRSELAKTMEQVCEDHEPVLITRKSEKSVVLISLEDFESMQETALLLRSPKNAKRLLESVDQLSRGKGLKRKLLE